MTEDKKVALVTGAAKRIGAVISSKLHQLGFNIALHYHHSQAEAQALSDQLNALRPDSAIICNGDIRSTKDCQQIISATHQVWKRIDVLVNNASSFYPTPLPTADEQQWNDLLGSNVKGPFFLSQAAAPYLEEANGNIVNIVDIHGERPLKNYPIYCIAKAGLIMMTKSLARELGPNVRVNGVAPGAILWPSEDNPLSEAAKDHIINRTFLKRKGTPDDIAQAVLFLIQANYITGQIIAVDGGRSIKD